ncbi:MAG: hypothetical protein ACXW30_03160 [Micavibrio sp.]
MHQQNSPSRTPESGNAFWFILLAIALLVALTVTITRSGENTEETGQRDRNRIQASDILRQAKSIEQAVQNMRMAGVPENDISFENSFVSGYTNTNCEAGNSCMVFATDGAGLTYKVPSADWLDSSESGEDLYGNWYFTGTACIPDVGTGTTGCAATASTHELIVALPWINESLCVEINRLSGIANPSPPPQINGSAYTATLAPFIGTFGDDGSGTDDSEIDTTNEDFRRHSTGCFAGGSSDPDGGYHFYHVLIPR